MCGCEEPRTPCRSTFCAFVDFLFFVYFSQEYVGRLQSHLRKEVQLERIRLARKKVEDGRARYLLELSVKINVWPCCRCGDEWHGVLASSASNTAVVSHFYLPLQERAYFLRRYVIRQPGLCEDPEFQYNATAKVHIVIPVRDQGAWVRHLLENLQAYYAITQDQNFNLILIDYGSQDTDVEAELARITLPAAQLIRLKPPFSRAGGVQAGIDAVTDPREIVFSADLHLHIPPGLLDDVRRNTIYGRTGFNPVLIRLGCDADPKHPMVGTMAEGYV